MMTVSRTASIALAAAMFAMPVAASAQSCLEPAEFDALVFTFAPSLIESASTTCRASLPADSYMARSSAALADRYRQASEGMGALSHRAILKISGVDKEKVNPLSDEEATRTLFEGMIGQALGKIKAEDCRSIDRIAALLDPLPPENFAGLFAAILEISQREDAAKGKSKGIADFAICRTPAR